TAFAQLDSVEVTFRVDMNGETVGMNGVHIAGNFQDEAGFPGDWQPGATEMTDEGGLVYAVTVKILKDSTYEYKFVNGNDWGMDESVPEDCGVDNGQGGYNRVVTVSSDTILDAFAYGACDVSVATNIADNLNAGQAFSIAPNPFTVFATISFSNVDRTAYTVDVMNLAGQVVKHFENVTGQEITIDNNNMTPGMYLVSFSNEAGERYTQKLIMR
ncbi:MAG: T9SS type A sorting domain-containing protein, partial [Bacteroidota bacterium]